MYQPATLIQPKRRSHRRLPPSLALLGLAVNRDETRDRPYQQIREAIRSSIISGEVMAGHRLPPTREMSTALGVNRATVMRAYQELAADGLVVSSGSRGTVVVRLDEDVFQAPSAVRSGTAVPGWLLTLPAIDDGGLRADATLIRDIVLQSTRRDIISFAAATPGPELIPTELIEGAMAQGIAKWGPSVLGYGPVEGLEVLRDALKATVAGSMTRRGDGIMVVSGATQGLALAARALIGPGDEVVVEAPTYVGILQTFSMAGARLFGVPVDRQGMRIDLLETVLSRRKVRLIVVQPGFQNPTGSVMSMQRREHLLLVARRYGVPVLEDDCYSSLAYGEAPPGSLKSIDRYGSVIYLSSFSKTISPGLRIGWVVAPEPVLSRLAVAKQFADLSSNGLGQAVVAELLNSGAYQEHLVAVTAEYRRRRDVLMAALANRLPQVVPLTVPTGGCHVWCHLECGAIARLLAASAIRRGVALIPGEAFYPAASVRGETGQDWIRLSFPNVTPDNIPAGVDRLRQAFADVPVALPANGGSRA
ncbi:MAG: PLP-dependent aminotransferase family protein, partial [Actinomycetota bacterium]|nr:PLP-dependent aminotransferase family protein [Actinomycetota bacterium]